MTQDSEEQGYVQEKRLRTFKDWTPIARTLWKDLGERQYGSLIRIAIQLIATLLMADPPINNCTVEFPNDATFRAIPAQSVFAESIVLPYFLWLSNFFQADLLCLCFNSNSWYGNPFP